MTRTRSGAAVVMLLGYMACGGSSGDPDGGWPNTEAQVPRCLADLVAPCTCKWAGDLCGPEACFVSGVTTVTTTPDAGSCNTTGDTAETRVYKPDGSLCYSIQTFRSMSMACEEGYISWLDPSGEVVAASAYGYDQFSSCGNLAPTVTCMATGETGVVPDPWPQSNCPTNGCP